MNNAYDKEVGEDPLDRITKRITVKEADQESRGWDEIVVPAMWERWREGQLIWEHSGVLGNGGHARRRRRQRRRMPGSGRPDDE